MDQELTYKWIQERLRELNSGTLSEQDRLRLVEIAKHDPFVSDALEGFRAHPDEEHALHLQAITAKIKQPKRERRRWLIPNLTVTAIAASILLIVATYAVITRIEHKTDETLFVFVAPDSLAQDDTTAGGIAMEAESRVADDVNEKMEAQGKAAVKAPDQNPTSTQAETRDVKSKSDAATATTAKTDIVTSEPPTSSTQPSAMPAAAVPADDEKKTAAEDVAVQSQVELSRSQRDEGYYANQMDPAMMQSRVTGHVADAHSGAPIMSAKLAVDYSNQLFYTDIEGAFELYIPQPAAVLQVTYPGYADTALIITPTDENIVVDLKPGNILPSNVIAGAKHKGPVSSAANDPVQSFRDFYNHITASSSLQLTTEPSAARRKVTLEFTVKKDGRPRDINILETSRDKTYDNEAKRLLESGPDWVCPDGVYPCTRRYTFYFR